MLSFSLPPTKARTGNLCLPILLVVVDETGSLHHVRRVQPSTSVTHRAVVPRDILGITKLLQDRLCKDLLSFNIDA